MAVIVGANSYIDETQLDDYAALRGVVISGDQSVLLIKAMDYLEAQCFKGAKTANGQTLQWPRIGVYIDGVLIDSSVVPQQVEGAQAVIAMSIDAGYDPLATYGPGVKSRSVDVLSTTYKDNSLDTSYSPDISRALRKIVCSGSGILQVNAAR